MSIQELSNWLSDLLIKHSNRFTTNELDHLWKIVEVLDGYPEKDADSNLE